MVFPFLAPLSHLCFAWSDVPVLVFWSVVVVQSLSRVQIFVTHGLQRARLPCPLLSELTQTHVHWVSWCNPAFSSSASPFFCPQSFPVSGSFPMSWLFASGYQSIGASASASVLPMNWFDLLAVQGTLKGLLQHHNLKASILWHSAFFMVSHLYRTTGKCSSIGTASPVFQETKVFFTSFLFLTVTRQVLGKCRCWRK